MGARQFQLAAALAGPLTAPTAVDVPTVTMPFKFGLGEIGHEVVLELTGGFEIVAAAMRALLRTDVVLDEDGAGRGLRSEKPGVLAVFLAAVIGGWCFGVVTAIGDAFAALADVLKLVLDLRQAAVEVRVLCFKFGDPLLQGGDQGQDGGLGLGRNGVPEWCGDRAWRTHTLYYEASVQRVRPGVGSGCSKIPNSKRWMLRIMSISPGLCRPRASFAYVGWLD